MSVLELNGASVEVTTFRGEEVILEAEDGAENVFILLTPGEAVRLSRALVKAAAEALGTSVDMTRTKEDMLTSISAAAAALPKGPL